MELDEAPAPTSRLDHLAELATSPTHANVHPPATSSSTSSSSSISSSSRSGQQQQYTHHPHSQHDESSKHHRTSSQSKSHSHSNSHSHSQSRPHMIQQQLEAESGAAGWSRSPITPTTTRKFNRMAIHEVLDGQNSPSFKRKGSPEEGSFSDPPTASSSRLNSRVSSSRAYGHSADSNHSHAPHHPHHAHFAPSSHQPHSPRFRQESPMPASNSDDDEDSDIRNYKKRRMLTSASSSSTSHHHHHSTNSHPHQHHHHKSSPSSSSPNGSAPSTAAGQSSTGGAGAQAEVMDKVRSTLKVKQQQKAIIEARQGGGVHPLSASTPTTASSPPSNGNNSSSKSKEGAINQPVTEKNPSGISVFHGSASFAALNRRPLTSPKNPKNAKSLTIFAPSYSESSLSIRSAPLQPSHGHNIMSMNPRTSQPLRHQTPHHHQPHPFSQHQHQATPTQSTHGSIPQPLRSPKTAGHIRKSSRATLRAGPHTAGLDSSSGTLPAPILSSHTGPLPSPMYPHPNTPFHPSSHASLAAAAAAAASTSAAAAGTMSKHHFMETVSNLFDSVDSSRSLKHTLEEQIRKSAQLLQTLQSSGTMIESLVRGQFKELEKGVLEKFESELDHLSARVRQLEEHQGLTPPPKKARISAPTTTASAAATVTVSSQNAMTGVVSTSNSTSTLSSSSSSPKAGSTSSMSPSPLHNHHSGSGSSMKDGMLPTPPLNKTQDSAMEVEDEEELPTAPPSSESTTSTTPPPQQQDQTGSSSEYRSSVKMLQERVASLEKRQEPAPASATATVQA
ncbi:hypothetical protein BG015_008134 [Linnemannia schmuckeri]|uniref:Uncharacterized protein n=1 Tax=Linnemannia schmuckeri TaxID=64567 RepID=A0A9P5VAR6_9FUNG|nr:hypothetical protein BG015_008134 [Linnemannia schmuckeri]